MNKDIKRIKKLLKIELDQPPFFLHLRHLNVEKGLWELWINTNLVFQTKSNALDYAKSQEVDSDSESIVVREGFRWEATGLDIQRRQYKICDSNGKVPKI